MTAPIICQMNYLEDRSSGWPLLVRLYNEPKLILADEPTGALDTKTSAAIMELFGQLHREGATIVLVTHESEIAEYASRTILVRDGYIVSDDHLGRVQE